MRLTLFVLLLACILGCGPDTPPVPDTAPAPASAPTPPLALTPYTYADSAALRPKGPYYSFHLRTLRAEGGSPELRQLVNATLADLILQDSSTATTSLEEALPSFLAREFADYESQPVDEGLLQESAAPYTQEVNQSTEVLYQDDSLLVLTHQYYEYLGGAHGMSYTTLLPFATEPPRRLRLDDLIRPGSEDQLMRLLTRAGTEIGDRLYVDTVPVTDNVAPLPGVLRFEYEPYAIGPYASGTIAIDLPYDSLQAVLRPGITGLLPRR